MESEKDMEIIEKVVRKLMEDEEFNPKTFHENLPAIEKTQQQRQLLSKLLSELESLEEDKNVSEESKEECSTVEDRICSEIDEKRKEEEEIMKELKNIKRQNSITHCLLTTLIVLTLAWQFSEVSLILKIKNGLSNPFKSVGGIVKGLWQTRSRMMKKASDLQKQVTEQASLKIPQLELPGVDRDDEHNQN